MDIQLSEYQQCLNDIERYRTLREQIDMEVSAIRKEIEELQNTNSDFSSLQRHLQKLYNQDEEYGAKMHELAIKRNLLEP